MTGEEIFLNDVLNYIKEHDPLHYKKVRVNVDRLSKDYKKEFYTFLSLLYKFFSQKNIAADKVAEQYLKMINDMRMEGITFKREKKYSCANQHEAYLKVYSQPHIMEYYMNALLMSQVLWNHHFKMLMFFNEQLGKPLFSNVNTVLDIGPGHGFFSYLVQSNIKTADDIDIVDISDSSLAMTKSIIGDGNGKFRYYNRDIFNYESDKKYDLIILGEVLEHLDHPLDILKKLSTLLSDKGMLWLTTPTNAPALDHVYLFRSKEEITDLLAEAGFKVEIEYGCYAEDVTEELAKKFDISYLYGAFLRNN
jgi:2-polyprenyl-3-methyl-5-hydroxy-6-metoxy-1,4-benzoquinol methylase